MAYSRPKNIYIFIHACMVSTPFYSYLNSYEMPGTATDTGNIAMNKIKILSS